MFMFVDGRPVVLSFALVEALYYKAFLARFPEAQVSLTQWRGSYEYQALYPDIQMIVETGVITRDAMNYIGDTIAQANEAIRRPACLYSRVPERFNELGYEASIRIATEETKGTVAICVGAPYTNPAYYRDVTLADDGGAYVFNASLNQGSISDAAYKGSSVTLLYSNHDGSNHIAMGFSGAVPPNNGAQLAMNVRFGADLFSCLMLPHATNPNEWEATDSNVAPLFAAAFASGQPLEISFWGDNRPVLDNPEDVEKIGNLIRDEMLPAGQWMEGDVEYDTALSNGEPITIRWTIPTEWNLPFRLTIVRRKGSPHPENTVDEIIEMFLANFNAVQGIGKDVYPATYLTTADLPWAASIVAEWTDSGETGWWSDDVDAAYNVKYTASLDPAKVVIV